MSDLSQPLGEWDVFDEERPGQDGPDRRYELDATFRRLFTTPEGIEVLEHLRAATLLQPTWNPNLGPNHGYAREGQNSIVRYIEQRMRRAELGPPTAQPREETRERRPQGPKAVPTVR